MTLVIFRPAPKSQWNLWDLRLPLMTQLGLYPPDFPMPNFLEKGVAKRHSEVSVDGRCKWGAKQAA